MAWLIFKRSIGKILLIEGEFSTDPSKIYTVRKKWNAHNETTSRSNGPCPNGTWHWSHYNRHIEMGFAPGCYRSAYGCEGIHVFRVPARSGIGIHAGRTLGQPDVVDAVKGKTLGCIRIPADAMVYINRMHKSDPISVIVVTN
ncbi:MAG TPA: hypothetical protein PLO67_10000 [Saprospiraceae bacterium]|nr:hypothetical protein [Saprospiraceae bacterium]HPI06221.1 hypothetical protein [Saprospiraceae bacterium]